MADMRGIDLNLLIVLDALLDARDRQAARDARGYVDCRNEPKTHRPCLACVAGVFRSRQFVATFRRAGP